MTIDVPVGPLRSWLEERVPSASSLEIDQLVEPSQGFSSRTLLFRARWRSEGALHERRLVARIQRDMACPLLADVFHQYRVMRAVSEASDAAVPPILYAEEGSAVLGAPFFIMERVEGRVPPDVPSYHAQGWFADELRPAQREHAWWNAVREMEKLHRIHWQCLPGAEQAGSQAPGVAHYLEHFIGRWYAWAAQGQRHELIERAICHLARTAPPAAQSGLVWNDARMGNTMFAADLSVSSLFDFEVASLGPAEIDLAWWLYAEDIFTELFGVERLAGIPRREDAIRGFESLYSRAMPHFTYYEAIAALKHAVISLRDYRNGKKVERPAGKPDFAAERLSRCLDRWGNGS